MIFRLCLCFFLNFSWSTFLKVPIAANDDTSIFDDVQIIVGKGENVGHHLFLLFPTVFPKATFLRVIKSDDCGIKG